MLWVLSRRAVSLEEEDCRDWLVGMFGPLIELLVGKWRYLRLLPM